MHSITMVQDGSKSRYPGLVTLLAVTAILAPMTGARLGKVGPAEVLAVGWCVFALLRFRDVRVAEREMFFWVTLWAAMLCGTYVGIGLTPDETQVSGIANWFFLGAVALVVSSVATSALSIADLELILRRIAIGAVVIYGILYLYSVTISMTFLGLPLWFAGVRYSGGGENPHQLALLMVLVIGVATREVTRRAPVRHRVIYGGVLVAAVFLGRATQSSTLEVAVLAGLLVWTVVLARHHFGSRGAVVVTSLVLSISIPFSEAVRGALLSFVESDANGEGRIRLWSDLGDVLDVSPIVGLGPGTHANNGTSEFHNSLLDFFALGGLVAAAAVVAYVGAALIRMWRADPGLAAIAVSLAAYGVAGFSFRRLVFWIGFVTLSSLAARKMHERELSTAHSGGETVSAERRVTA